MEEWEIFEDRPWKVLKEHGGKWLSAPQGRNSEKELGVRGFESHVHHFIAG